MILAPNDGISNSTTSRVVEDLPYIQRLNESLAALKTRYLDARMSGDFKLADDLNNEAISLQIRFSSPSPVLDSLDDDTLEDIDNQIARIQSLSFSHEGSEDDRFCFEYSPIDDGREGVLFQIGSQDVVAKHQNINYQWSPSGGAAGGLRGIITKLSPKSLNRMKLHARNVPDGIFKAILTLTYPKEYTTDGKEVKRHFDLMKRWLKRHGCKDAFWFLEFQKRGAPHFHVFLKVFPVGGVSAVANAWHKIVGTDDEKHLAWHLGELSGTPCLEWLRNPHAASAYVTKYASKKEQKEVPEGYQNVGRFWGCWGAARPVWRYVSGRGDYAVSAAWSVVLNARAAWSDDCSDFARKIMFSTTMWGGAAVFDDLLEDADWVPF